tara:strand:- start:385 stop:678 length:294 start_codon:yes stop_codon:yes gene_type:complete
MVDLAKAILAINPSAQFNINADDIAQIEWTKGTTTIASADILAKQAELQTAYDNDYARKRLEEYPSIEECVHAILDDDLVALQEKRTAVKAKYPKGG